MKALKTLILFAVLSVCGMNAMADKSNNLIYNSEEVNGVMVGQTVYKMEGSALANYMKYNYKYDEQNRMIESEALKWDAVREEWKQDMVIRYAYQGKSVTTTYYKWNKKQKDYVLVPEMTVTMDNANL